jgi:hypothetical protein
MRPASRTQSNRRLNYISSQAAVLPPFSRSLDSGRTSARRLPGEILEAQSVCAEDTSAYTLRVLHLCSAPRLDNIKADPCDKAFFSPPIDLFENPAQKLRELDSTWVAVTCRSNSSGRPLREDARRESLRPYRLASRMKPLIAEVAYCPTLNEVGRLILANFCRHQAKTLPVVPGPIAEVYSTSPACPQDRSLQGLPKSKQALLPLRLGPRHLSPPRSNYRINPWCPSFFRKIDGGNVCPAIYWFQQPLRMFFVFRCARARARSVLLTHISAVFDVPVVFGPGEVIDLRLQIDIHDGIPRAMSLC